MNWRSAGVEEQSPKFLIKTINITQIVSQNVRNGELPPGARVSQAISGVLWKKDKDDWEGESSRPLGFCLR